MGPALRVGRVPWPAGAVGGAEWHSHAAKSFISCPLQAGASEVAMVQEPIPLHQVVELLFAVVSARLVRLLDEVLVVAGQGVHGGETGGGRSTLEYIETGAFEVRHSRQSCSSRAP